MASCATVRKRLLSLTKSKAMTLGGLIRTRRKELGKTQGQLAKEAGLTIPTINRFEVGRAHLLSDGLERVLKALRGKITWED